MDTCASPREGVRHRLPLPAERLALGASGLLVSPVCVGIVHDPEVVPAALEAGINFFFLSADLHWPGYEATRAGLRQVLRWPGVRERLVVSVVSYLAPAMFKHLQFDEVLGAVPGLDRIDVLLSGASTAEDSDSRLRALAHALQRRRFGARALGASFHDRPAARAALEAGAVDIAYVRYNPGHRGARAEVFPFASARQPPPLVFNFKSTMFFEPGSGPWRPAVTDHYRYALSTAPFDGVLVALSSPREVEALAAALAAGPLEPWQAQEIDALARARVQALRREAVGA